MAAKESVGLEGNVLSSVLPTVVQAHWKSLDLESLRSKLDEQGLAIAERQDGARQTRAALADRTKEFRRTASPEVVKQFSSLLKAYQEEIDRLTGRAKQGEAAFLDLYRVLYAAPDPAPALAAGLEAASRAAELEAQVTKLAQELAEYKAESRELKNQDLTIRKLQEKVASLEADLTEKDRELEEQQEEAAAEAQERLVAEVQEKEARLADELVQTRTALEALQRLHQNTQNQLFSIQSRTEDEAAGMQSELEFATAEMERAQQRLGMLEREKEALLAKVHAAAAEREAEAAGGSRGAEESLRQELTAQRELSARLQVEVSGLRRQVEGETAAWSARYEGLKSTLEAREAHCAALEAELTARPTQREMDELRSQVRILHAVGYNAFDEEDAGQPGIGPDGARGGGALGEGAAGGSGGGRGSGTRARSLEAALLAKAKHLEHQLTMSKLELSDVRGEAEAATAKVADLQAELEEQKALVAKLEEDLVTADQAGGGLAAENTARTSSEALPDGASGGGGEAGGSGADGGGDQAMLLVLTAQRDRFRNRVRDLEEGVSMLTQDLQRVRNEAQAVRADNLALVERLKFVQGYASSSSQRKQSTDVEAGSIVHKYSEEYEASMNPFADFKAREKEARRRQLPLQDKAMLMLTGVITSNQAARTAIFCYALLLHCVIFLVLARHSHHHIATLEEMDEMCLHYRQADMFATNVSALQQAATAGSSGAALGQAAAGANGAMQQAAAVTLAQQAAAAVSVGSELGTQAGQAVGQAMRFLLKRLL